MGRGIVRGRFEKMGGEVFSCQSAIEYMEMSLFSIGTVMSTSWMLFPLFMSGYSPLSTPIVEFVVLKLLRDAGCDAL